MDIDTKNKESEGAVSYTMDDPFYLICNPWCIGITRLYVFYFASLAYSICLFSSWVLFFLFLLCTLLPVPQDLNPFFFSIE